MTAGVWVNRDRTRVVPEGSPEAAFRLHLRDAQRLGLLEPEDRKMARRPADKMARRPADKGARK
ncbi:MAG TPA: hypothetical protein VLM76_11705 [Patescibacteria group bacterium]|nr:hypothetical protein [Patescibacteria group bacterium]